MTNVGGVVELGKVELVRVWGFEEGSSVGVVLDVDGVDGVLMGELEIDEGKLLSDDGKVEDEEAVVDVFVVVSLDKGGGTEWEEKESVDVEEDAEDAEEGAEPEVIEGGVGSGGRIPPLPLVVVVVFDDIMGSDGS